MTTTPRSMSSKEQDTEIRGNRKTYIIMKRESKKSQKAK